MGRGREACVYTVNDDGHLTPGGTVPSKLVFNRHVDARLRVLQIVRDDKGSY